MADVIFDQWPDHWTYLTLGELCESVGGSIQTGPFGSQLHAADYVEEGIPSIMPQNIGDNRVNEDGIARITQEDAQRLSRYLVKPGDIVYSRRGDVERRALISEREAGWLCGTGCLRISVHHETIDTTFLSFYLGHPAVRSWIVRHAHGATMPNLNTSILGEVPMLFPPLSEQRAIAHILGTLDDKIELNRKMNETLEAMARALFKSWFVDFDPVRRNMARRRRLDTARLSSGPKGCIETTAPLDDRRIVSDTPNAPDTECSELREERIEVPGHSATADEIDALFPNEFEFVKGPSGTELVEVPKGWRVGKLGDAFNITMGQSPPGETYNEAKIGLPFYQGRTDFGFRFPKVRMYCTEPKRIAKPGDTLVSVRAPVGDFNIAMTECCIGRGVAAVRHNSLSESYTYYAIGSIQPKLEAFESEGTVFGAINKESFENLTIIEPAANLITQFDRIVQAMDGKIRLQSLQIEELTALRDTLLPKLISGELRAVRCDPSSGLRFGACRSVTPTSQAKSKTH